MAKKPELTVNDLQTAANLEDLPTLRPLLADVERLAADLEALETEAEKLTTSLASYSPYKLGKLEERRAPIESALAEARTRVRDEETRLRDQVDAIIVPKMADTLTRLMTAIDAAVPIDEELRGLERLRHKFVPNHYAMSRSLNLRDQLARCVRFMESRSS